MTPPGATVRRYNRQGIDVTEDPSRWTPDDCEIIRTQYHHPDVLAGQHTNGPAQVWIRLAEYPPNFVPHGKWVNTNSHKAHEVVESFKNAGIESFDEVP